MAYRNWFYPPEIDDWSDPDFDEERQTVTSICSPACCPNPNCFPRTCTPSTNFATCCPNPNSIYNIGQVTACSPQCFPFCTPRFCNPRACNPRACNPRTCNPRLQHFFGGQQGGCRPQGGGPAGGCRPQGGGGGRW